MDRFSQAPFAHGSSALRVFDERSTSSADWSAEMTLSAFYFYPLKGWRAVLERLRKSPRTIDQYDQSIGYWSLYARGSIDKHDVAKPGLSEPKLCQIAEDLLNFQYVLAAVPGLGSVNTIRKHVTHVQAVLDRTGPTKSRDPRLRLAVGLLDEVPLLEKPPEYEHEVMDDFETDEISLILGACRLAKVPEFLPPEQRPRYWRNLITVTANTALRIGSVVVDSSELAAPIGGARWDGLSFHRGRTWLKVRQKGRKEKSVCVNEFALAAIEDMRPLTGDRQQIFYWPHRLNWLHDNHGLIVAASGLAADRRFGFHAYRKWFDNEASQIDALGAAMQSGHSFHVMVKNYANKKRMATAVDHLPQPKAPSQQLELF